jgi:hypothetical protein
MKRTIASNSSLVYILPVLAIAIYVFSIINLDDLSALLILTAFILFFIFSHIGYLLRPRNCILADQKNLYLYPKYKEEFIISISDIKSVNVENYARKSGLPRLIIITKSNVIYRVFHISSPFDVAKSILDLMSKEMDSLNPFNPFDAL